MQQNKMTVSSIVQKLLEQGHITAEEALVLLKAEIRNTPCCPTISPQPLSRPQEWINPYRVGDVPPYGAPWFSSGTGNPGPSGTLNDNFTSK